MSVNVFRISNLLILSLMTAVTLSAVGCSNMEKRKFVFWGDVVFEKPESISDHWSDYGPFKLNNPAKKLRRGKAGVVRFYKEKDFVHSIPVDGELVVYVYQGEEEGVELTEPMARLVLTSEQLNSQRKFDKKNGYSYHIWLDLGEIDAPAENISILTVFNDTKTRDQVASGITYTRIDGKEKSPTDASDAESAALDPIAWAKQARQSNQIPLLSDEEREKFARQKSGCETGENRSDSNTSEPGASETDRPTTTIELSLALTEQMRCERAEPASSDVQSRYASYLSENSAASPTAPGRWEKMPEGTEVVQPILTAQKTGAIPPAPVASQEKKISFDDLRTVSGPASSGAYFTQGTVTPSGVQVDAPFGNNANPPSAATVLY